MQNCQEQTECDLIVRVVLHQVGTDERLSLHLGNAPPLNGISTNPSCVADRIAQL